ncbi:hypothetical protein NC653_027133 [Populus alba x Populus x berolinensis]|uniref:Uncharacterized protein n=1 Tax=Populus alba x Populus x berolinensis TaxID=444605 RepID=A0AAD6Q6F7_9ROSI|nr:hypothetical protein NC653_027133 [Populus alba x Populus x berolinensis]
MYVCLAILRSSVSFPYCDILIPGLEKCYVCTVQDLSSGYKKFQKEIRFP